MKEIEVGNYVRINNDFRLIALGIGKVIRINQDTIYVKMNFELPFSFKRENIVKHSKQLIDLIEVGDIVEIFVEIFDVLDEDVIYIYDKEMLKALKEDIKNGAKIRRILTHQQYMANCYEVGGEDV